MALRKLNIPLPVGGLVVDKPGEYIDNQSISNNQNTEVKRNEIRQRQGGIALGASMGERILGMAELERSSETYLVRIGLTEAEVYNQSTEAWTSIANAALTATAEEQVDFAFPLLSANRIMVYTNGIDAIRKFNGGGNDADLGGSPPKCKYVLDFGGYLLLAYVIDGGNNYFARVQWCDTGDPENWSTGNTGSVDLLEDSLDITGIAVFGNYVAVHKESAIYLGQLVGTSDVFVFSRKETGAGTVANGSIQNLPDGTQIFLARDGLRIFNGVTSTPIPSSINQDLMDSMNPAYLKRVCSIVVRDLDEVWFGIPIGSDEEPQTVYKYNYRTGQCYKDSREGLMAMSLLRVTDQESWDEDPESWDSDTTRWDDVSDLSLQRKVVFGDLDGVTSIRSSSPNDIGAAIDSIWDTKDFTIMDLEENGDSFGQMVRWDELEIWAKGSGLSLWYSIDSGTSWTLVGTKTLDSGYPTDDAPDIFYFDVVSSKIRFRFRNSNVDESWTMKQFWIGYSIRENRR